MKYKEANDNFILHWGIEGACRERPGTVVTSLYHTVSLPSK